MNILSWIDQRKHWWKVFVLIFAVSVAVVGYVGVKTYQFAPPVCSFVDEQGNEVFTGKDINAGQQIFLRYGLMEYGSFLGEWGTIYERFGVPAEIGLAQAILESGLDGRVRSPARAVGLPHPAPRSASAGIASSSERS